MLCGKKYENRRDPQESKAPVSASTMKLEAKCLPRIEREGPDIVLIAHDIRNDGSSIARSIQLLLLAHR
jgi:hypothetical protein